MNQATSEYDLIVSGCGWVTPFAWGSIAEVLTALAATNIRNRPGVEFFPIPDDVLNDCGDLGSEIRKDKGAAIASVALRHALDSASLVRDHYPADRTGLVLGSALAGQLGMIQFANEVRAQTARFVSPIHFPQTVGNYISGALAREWAIRGPNSFCFRRPRSMRTRNRLCNVNN